MSATSFEDKLKAIRFGAEDGNLDNMFVLGIAHALGVGCEQDLTEAAKWFHEASRRGHLRAKTSLGYLYSKGDGVRHDVLLAHIFLSEAADFGDLLAPDLLTRLRRHMSPSQIKEATKRTKNRRVG